MALESLSVDVQIELLEVLANICLIKDDYNKLVIIDYTVDNVYLKNNFIKYWEITDEEFNTKFSTGIPEFRADSNLFKSYIEMNKEKNYPEFDEYVNTLDEMYMSIQSTEGEQIWIETVEMSFENDKYNNYHNIPVVYIGGFVEY